MICNTATTTATVNAHAGPYIGQVIAVTIKGTATASKTTIMIMRLRSVILSRRHVEFEPLVGLVDMDWSCLCW